MTPKDDPSAPDVARLQARIAELEAECQRLHELSQNGYDSYRELFERSADPILIIEGGRFVDCNEAAVRILRCSDREEALQTHPSELSPPTQPDGKDSRSKADEMISLAFEHGSHRFEWDHKRADGEVFPVEVLLTAFRTKGKRVLYVVWRDISERKGLEDQLRHSQKMEAIGQLAGGIAHDFNNLLVAIVGHADLLQHSLTGRPELLDDVHEIQQAGDRAVSLVRQLLAFSRKQEIRPRVVDLNLEVTKADKLLRRLIGENVLLEVQCDDRPLPVFVDPGQVEQIIVNLTTNARDAMPGGGALTLKTQRTEITPVDAEEQPDLSAGQYALLTVSDNGEGMDQATLSRAFEPFFTTKEVGKGTGLGLATVYGIVRHTGGKVSIYSQPGRGTTVKVLMPITTEKIEAEAVKTPVVSPRGTETVLVVEDELAVSKLVANVLRSHGYRVLHAANGLEALSLWDQHGEKIDLLLTDTVMPNLGGPELVTELLRTGVEPRVLFMSGYTRENLGPFEAEHGPVDLLEKPFSASQLATRVRSALDRASSQ